MRDLNRESVLPDTFCWTKMGADGGQELNVILRRKDLERRHGQGEFWWGIGERLRTRIEKLRAFTTEPVVVFSEKLTPAASHDANPAGVLVWRSFLASDGSRKKIPGHVLVLSREHQRSGARKEAYYALVCHTGLPLTKRTGGVLYPSRYRNVGGKGGPLGTSQVTAVIERIANGRTVGRPYPVDIVASLTEPFFVELAEPQQLSPREVEAADRAGEGIMSRDDWLNFVKRIRGD